MIPLWAVPVASAVGCAALVGAALLVEEWVGRRRRIDLTGLTVDPDVPVETARRRMGGGLR